VTGPRELVNVAAVCPRTRALGPGTRAVVWVQGCPFDCAGCIAPDWLPPHPARQVTPAELVGELCPAGADGLTFSGGEPMQQAAALAQVIRLARQDVGRHKDLSLICFTGYRLEELRRDPPTDGVPSLLSEVDVLIDGRYVAALDDNRGLRGSSNQRVHFLTDRLKSCGYDFTGRPRSAEIKIADGSALLVGIPPAGVLAGLDAAHARVGAAHLPRVPTSPSHRRSDSPTVRTGSR
jgi:anaerobic ribonucleoside-triphosphate reductase activating protein